MSYLGDCSTASHPESGPGRAECHQPVESPNYRGSKSFIVDAHQVIDHWDKTGDLAYVCSPRSMIRALNFSAASNEVLFLGRVFEKDRLETTYWTREVSTNASQL